MEIRVLLGLGHVPSRQPPHPPQVNVPDPSPVAKLRPLLGGFVTLFFIVSVWPDFSATRAQFPMLQSELTPLPGTAS